MKQKKGFTLVELLIVIAIIGILASIVLVNLSGERNRAKDAEFKSGASSLQKAYIVECSNEANAGDSPTTLVTSPSTVASATDGGSGCGSDGSFSVTVTPNAGVSATCTGATLTATGADYTNCP